MTAEIERFLADAQTDAALQAELVKMGTDLGAAIGMANARGYEISRADADAYIAARKSELSDEQLDHVAGGGHKKKKGDGGNDSGLPDYVAQYKHY